MTRLSRRPLRLALIASVVLFPAAPASAEENTSHEIGSADFNGDGYADLAVGVPGEDLKTEHGSFENAGAVNVVYGSPKGLTKRGAQSWTETRLGGASFEFEAFGAEVAWGDVNLDGYDDLAIGVPGHDVFTPDVDPAGAGATAILEDVGEVYLVYGSARGLTAEGAERFAPYDVATEAPEGARFGTSVALGDLGRSEASDLAIGAPGEGEGAGSVYIAYREEEGGFSGLERWTQETSGVEFSEGGGKVFFPFNGDAFGFSLFIGDFGGDPHDDLVVGVPGEDDAAGAVIVFFLLKDEIEGAVQIQQGEAARPGAARIQGGAEPDDWFGYSVFGGDFSQAEQLDLAIGAPLEDVGPPDAGAVNVLYGSEQGPGHDRNEMWHQGRPGIKDDREEEDFFGWALHAANFGLGEYDDLAIGVPCDDADDVASPVVGLDEGCDDDATIGGGAVQVLYSASDGRGLTARDDWWNQDSSDAKGEAEGYDFFGGSLAAGNFDGRTLPDLAVGIPAEDLEGGDEEDAGAIQIFYSNGSRLTAYDQLWTQASLGVGAREGDDGFGAALAA